MLPTPALAPVLEASSDSGNPGADELAALFGRIRRIAVIGLSRDPEKAARRVPSYLAAKGYEVVPVNPHADRILGRDAWADIRDVPGEVELVLIFRPSHEAGAFVRTAAGRPERPVVWLQEGIRADAEIDAMRAEGRLAVQDLCAYRVHRELVP